MLKRRGGFMTVDELEVEMLKLSLESRAEHQGSSVKLPFRAN
jgi:hypothetical protein